MNTIFFNQIAVSYTICCQEQELLSSALNCYIQKFVYVFIILTQLKFIVGPIEDAEGNKENKEEIKFSQNMLQLTTISLQNLRMLMSMQYSIISSRAL